MATETERKFLFHSDILPQLLAFANFLRCGMDKIEQFYITSKPVELRIRKENNHHYLTVKGKGTVSRLEVEVEINKSDYEQLRADSTGVVFKRRYFIPAKDTECMWEFDVYEGANEGLVVAEFEFSEGVSELPVMWEFMKTHLIREVTDEPEYKNANLVEPIV